MEPYGSEISKRYSYSYENIFFNQTFSTYFLWQSSQNLLIGILKFQIWFLIFLNMGPYGSENFKTLLLLQFWFFFDQTFSECSL